MGITVTCSVWLAKYVVYGFFSQGVSYIAHVMNTRGIRDRLGLGRG